MGKIPKGEYIYDGALPVPISIILDLPENDKRPAPFSGRVFATENTEDFDEVVEQMTDIVNAYLAENEEENA